MRQTTLSVTLEVKPESVTLLELLVDAIHDRGPAGAVGIQAGFAWFMAKVPSVHFLSMNVFPGSDYDPLFVIEANFDGRPSAFWGQLEAAMAEDLRAMLRCCKRPLDGCGPLYDAVAQADSRTPVAPYLEARTNLPSVFHHGNRGMTRDRILAERDLFFAIRKELASANGDGPSPYRGTTPVQVHDDLRRALLPGFAWLGESSPARIPLIERIGDWVRLALFAFVAILVLSLPGMILAPMMPDGRLAILLALLTLGALIWLRSLSDALPGTDTGGRSLWRIALRYLPRAIVAVLLYGLFMWGVSRIIAPPLSWLVALMTGGMQVAQAGAQRALEFGLASLPFSLVAILGWVRFLERRDSSHDKPPIDEEVMRQMAQREDWIPQNHMGSIVLLKPGILRTVIVHAGHHALGLALRALPASGVRGYLGSMRTVHFAHWAFTNNSSRLMFFSNFDQSWESYLDDFIEKAHEGLTLAWGCGVGFPATRFLVQDGASNGRQFKAWARHSMAISRFWYSAYSDLTVDQVERNNRIADGLRKKKLSSEEAAAWIIDL